MDEMILNLNSNFMRNFIAKLVSKLIYQKTGYKVDVKFNALRASIVNGDMHVSTSIDASLSSDEFNKIVKSIDL